MEKIATACRFLHRLAGPFRALGHANNHIPSQLPFDAGTARILHVQHTWGVCLDSRTFS
jgi:hypothetical protein